MKSTLDDNDEKLFEEFQEFPNIQKIHVLDFFYYESPEECIFVPVNIFKYEEGTCERGILITFAIF